MKAIDILPCSREKKYLEIPRIPLFQYTPTLAEELEKGLLDAEEALTLYRAMLIQRNFEYMVRDLDNKRFVPHEGYEFRGTTHLSVGQEATAMGAMSVLSRSDYITSNHRGHGHCIGKGLFALYGMDEEELEEFSEGDHEGIKGYLHDFRVAGGSRAHLLIRGIHHPPTRVAGHHFQHASQVLEDCFCAPEAAAA